MRNSKKVMALCLVAGALGPTAAWAYGVEIPENGATAFGRGGAFTARASDPSAVMHNVAGIMGLPGFQLTLSSNVGAFSHCYQRSGNYDGVQSGATVNTGGTVFEQPGGGARYTATPTPYPQICKEGGVALAPMLLGTYRVHRRLAIGFGVYAPSTQGSGQNFPDTVSIPDPMAPGGSYLAPSPARYLLFRKNLLVLHPVVAVAWQPTNWLRVGLGIEPSIARFQFGLHANGDSAAPQSPASDVFIGLDAFGFFMAGSASIQVMPLPFLSAGVNFHYNAPITATGTANNVGSPYAAMPANRIQSSFEINEMSVTLPWTLRAGVRYHMPRAGRPTENDGTGTYDPMTDDVFDIEADFNYERTSMLSETSLRNSGSIRVDSIITANAPATITIRSALTDVMGVRVGGDWNILPGQLAARLGFSYETAGASPDLAQIHLPAYAGASVHAGLSYRWRWLTVTAGFGHFFFQDNVATTASRAITIPSQTVRDPNNPPAGLTREGQIDPATGCMNNQRGAGACTINRGVYSSSFTAGSIQFTLRL